MSIVKADNPADTVIISQTDVEHTWLVQDTTARDDQLGSWKPIRRCDQRRLREAHSNGMEDVVIVDGGRSEVQLKRRMLVDRYGRDPPRESQKISQALWFRWIAGQLEPYDEKQSESIEECYRNMVDLATHVEKVETDTVVEQTFCGVINQFGRDQEEARQIRLRLTPQKEGVREWYLAAEEEPADWTMFAKKYAVQRGFGEVPLQLGEIEEEKLSDTPGRVFLYVHGIGEAMWDEDGSGLHDHTEKLRINLHRKQLQAAGYEERVGESWQLPESDGEVPPPAELGLKDEVLEASWWRSVHTDALEAQLKRITLPSMPHVRQIANQAVADALYYMTGKHRETLLCAVINALEGAVARFRSCHPDFKGDFVCVGHSLGGVLLFETLRRRYEKLSFVPSALFTLGSPVGIFLHCSGDVPPCEYQFPNMVRYYNIFHPLDPIAYRIEPLLKTEMESAEPEQVPCFEGGLKAHHGIQNFFRWATTDLEKEQEGVRKMVRALKLNHGDRIDWIVQDDINVMGGTGEILQAIPAHCNYSRNADVGSFLHVRGSLQAPAVPEEGVERDSRQERLEEVLLGPPPPEIHPVGGGYPT
eukprot:gnl/MRDRNA2_/MRDRNA2_145577_c0_seq1.p1 gnl/MRDRNA2_/MRDRNA2_145577_c0~~gnl/MRDRNA2_/MRDRNA2_145577_c0_seq1.p1  ORF type:complete len:588 (+),score=111.09 gnl/MRDRNA2_/MRDRNA2_145577_c0_seq1:69-1832(+)